MNKEDIIKKCISDYISARKKLLEIGNLYPELIGGNDNVIGRIGEFYWHTLSEKYRSMPKESFQFMQSGI